MYKRIALASSLAVVLISACVGPGPATTLQPPTASTTAITASPAAATDLPAPATPGPSTPTPGSGSPTQAATHTRLPPTPEPAAATPEPRNHTIAPGETLFSIAARYSVSVDALRAANGLTGDLIYAGQVLRIPTDATTTQPPTSATGAQPFPSGGPRHVTLTQSAGATLAGSRWALAGLNGGSVLTGTGLTLAFTAEGFSGSGACAGFSATYLVRAPGVLEVGPTAITEQACDPQVRVDTLGFFSSLADATTWAHDARYLYLRDGAGNTLATLTRPEVGLPTITALTVTASAATADSALTIAWTTTDVSATRLQVVHGDDHVSQWAYAVDQAANGRVVLDQIPQHNGGTTRVVLEAYGPNGLYVTESATVQLPCRYASPFAPSYPHGCPSGSAASVQLVEQRFEQGWMLWLSDPAWVGGAVDILVLYDGGDLDHYADTWRDGDPGLVDVAPAGLFVPQRGFGAVWGSYDNVRQGLGWATELEHPVTNAQVQRFGGYRQPTLHLRLSDGRVVYLTAPSSGPHSWQFD